MNDNAPDRAAQAARREIERGQPLLAFDRAQTALARWPGHVGLRQIRGLALSRSGAVEAAVAAFQELADEGRHDEETLGNLAAGFKTLWLMDGEAPDADSLRCRAAELYRLAYGRTRGVWSGINAATLELAGGRGDIASELACEVEAACLQRLSDERDEGERYWLLATLGEAALLQGRVDDAAMKYREATSRTAGRFA
ncbi:MAG: hypothetical protein KDA61_17490, partial [Planctomycetales bacterium]|nr:hypothetical protein [Planctomycetales bacterium]